MGIESRIVRSLGLGLAMATLTVALTGCGSGSLLRPAASASDDGQVRELQARILELQRRAAVQQVELARLRERVAELEARDGGGTRPRARVRSATPPEPVASRQASPVPPTRLRDRPDLEVTEIVEESDVAPEEMDAPGSTPPGPAAPLPTVSSGARPPAAVGDLPPPSAAARAQYDRAYTLFHQGRYVDAEAAFRRFLQDHADNDHGDNAQYWIGRTRFETEDYRGALAAFRETAERYPGGNKVPDALLEAGRCLEELGDSEGARETYREIARRFGDSAAAAVAEQRLAAIP